MQNLTPYFVENMLPALISSGILSYLFSVSFSKFRSKKQTAAHLKYISMRLDITASYLKLFKNEKNKLKKKCAPIKEVRQAETLLTQFMPLLTPLNSLYYKVEPDVYVSITSSMSQNKSVARLMLGQHNFFQHLIEVEIEYLKFMDLIETLHRSLEYWYKEETSNMSQKEFDQLTVKTAEEITGRFDDLDLFIQGLSEKITTVRNKGLQLERAI